MKDAIQHRFDELLQEGLTLKARIPSTDFGDLEFYIERNNVPGYQAWITSAANLIKLAFPATSHFHDELKTVTKHPNLRHGFVSEIFLKMLGMLQAAKSEWEQGLAKEIEYIFMAEAFDGFLDHAQKFHKAGKVQESSILASVVLEDTVKRIAKKNGVTIKNKSLEPIIDELVKLRIFTPIKAKRVKSYASVRNHALHAEWDAIDIKDVGSTINGLRELIEDYL